MFLGWQANGRQAWGRRAQAGRERPEGVGMYARVTWCDGESSHEIDRDLHYFEEELLGKAKEVPGMAGGLVLVDRERGRTIAITFWEDEHALADSREVDATIRDVLHQRLNLSCPAKVWEYEVGVAALEHPVKA